MATKDELATAIKVVKEIAGEPTIGPIKELIDLLSTPVETKAASKPANEARVTVAEETR